MDCDAQGNNAIAHRFGVNGYPTLKWFPKGRNSEKEEEPYNGERSVEALVNFVNEHAGKKKKKKNYLKMKTNNPLFFLFRYQKNNFWCI